MTASLPPLPVTFGPGTPALRHDMRDYYDGWNACHAAFTSAIAAQAQPATTVQPDLHQQLFQAACIDLGLISKELGLEPSAGGAWPVIAAIRELRVVQPVQPTPTSPHKDEPRGCYRVRCQLGKVCVERSPASIAYLLIRPSGFSWAAVPRELSPVVREMLLKDNVKIEPLYAHSAPAGSAAGQGLRMSEEQAAALAVDTVAMAEGTRESLI